MKYLSLLLMILIASFCMFSNEPALAACGCQNMTVTWAGPVNICSNNDLPDLLVPNGGECTRIAGGDNTACPNNLFIYKLPNWSE